jgi:hypothetical protein
MARPARLERATYGFEVRRSIQLSYGREAVMISPGVRQDVHRIPSGRPQRTSCHQKRGPGASSVNLAFEARVSRTS